jgi:hypothetical protein
MHRRIQGQGAGCCLARRKLLLLLPDSRRRAPLRTRAIALGIPTEREQLLLVLRYAAFSVARARRGCGQEGRDGGHAQTRGKRREVVVLLSARVVGGVLGELMPAA